MTSPLLVHSPNSGSPNSNIEQANANFNKCVQAITPIVIAGNFANNQKGGFWNALNQGVLGTVDAQKECLSRYPLAAASPNYTGIVLPGDL
jgi:hypothetical protein